ncbi:transposase [Candidatus Woesearchaeota archaeon]|nr:transposase [Candidatus Woesearchaeota archaeon]
MVIHCIKCGIVGLTSSKLRDLDHEYNGFQWWMQFGIDKNILSQHKRAKGYSYKNNSIKYKDYPLIIPYSQVRYRYKDTKLTKHWIKISVRKRKGIGIWLPVSPHKKLPDFKFLKDSLLLKNKKDNYELRLIFDIPIPKIKPQNILAIDLGERNIATVCDSQGKVAFFGREVRGLRRHYALLRRNLGRKRLLKKIIAMGQKEKNRINNVLHQISNTIIAWAKERKAIIVLGDLKGIRNLAKGRVLRRLLSAVPFFRLTNMISYKAEQNGLQVFKINEKYTSKMCHKCGSLGTRDNQSSFSCDCCGLHYNADLNGARNILNRAIEQCLIARALADAPKIIETND